MRIGKYLFLVIIVIGIIIGYFSFKRNNPAFKTNSEIKPTFSLAKPPTKSLKGRISTLTGEVKYLSRVATQEATLVNLNKQILQGENYLTGKNANLLILFDKACLIELSENTELRIIQTLPKNIVFSQTTGTVRYQNQGQSPISIRTAYLLTQLNGRALIERDLEQSSVSVSIQTGQATVAYNDLNYLSHTQILKAGENFRFNYDTRQGVVE